MIKDGGHSLFFAIHEVTVRAFLILDGGFGQSEIAKHCSGQYFRLKLNCVTVFYRRRSRSLSSRRRKSRSPTPRRHKSRSPTPRRRKSRSPMPRRSKKQRKRSTSLSPSSSSPSTSAGSKEMKDASEKLRKEEEKKRYNYCLTILIHFLVSYLYFCMCGACSHFIFFHPYLV